MKIRNYLFGIALTSLVLSACTKDDTTDNPPLVYSNIELQHNQDNTYYFGNIMASGSQFTIETSLPITKVFLNKTLLLEEDESGATHPLLKDYWGNITDTISDNKKELFFRINKNTTEKSRIFQFLLNNGDLQYNIEITQEGS
jgi:hypothetical protein